MPRPEGRDNIIDFPLASAEFEGAARWLARLDRGLDASEQAEISAWLAEKPAHGEALLELARLWDELDCLEPLAGLLPLSRPRVQERPRWGLGLAAVLAALLIGGLGTQVGLWPAGEAESAVTSQYQQRFSTAIGQRAEHALPDGSSIVLNTGSELLLRYSATERRVELRRGEAHFVVAQDAARPFTVLADGRLVQALGTAFNVRLQEAGQLEVTVTEGVVQVLAEAERAAAAPQAGSIEGGRTAGGVARVREGQTALLRESSLGAGGVWEVQSLAAVDLDIRLAWQRGVLVFEGEPLRRVLAEFGRYSTMPIALADPALGELRVGGYFATGDTEGLLQALQDNFQIRVERRVDGGVILHPEG